MCAEFGAKCNGFADFRVFSALTTPESLRGIWQKVAEPLRVFVSRGLAEEGVRGWRAALFWLRMGERCSKFAKMEIDRKTACFCERSASSNKHCVDPTTTD